MVLCFDEPEHRDPTTCKYGTYVSSVDRVSCTYSGAPVCVNCHRSLCGEPPHCLYEPIDNSPETVRRRLKWMEDEG